MVGGKNVGEKIEEGKGVVGGGVVCGGSLFDCVMGGGEAGGALGEAVPIVPVVVPEGVEERPDAGEVARRLRRVQGEVRKRVWRRSLRAFVERAWPIVEPERGFQSNWHIERLCELLQEVSEGRVRRLLITIPPGVGKSLLVGVLWPAWEWASRPELRWLTASYSSHLTIRDNLKVRSIVTSPWYREYFGVKLMDDQNAKTLFKTTAGGWRVASSVGGPGTGEHPDRIVIDDPLTADQARSEVERGAVNTWFDQTISTRGVLRDTAIVVVQQRLHQDDLAGHLLERGGWLHVSWPMRWEGVSDGRDPRTTVGELLWPEMFTEKIVRQLELDLGEYGSAGQLQQRPAPEGGGLFKKEWFRIAEASPAQARRVRGWDTAASEGKGDWTVGVRMAEVGGVFYIEDVCRGQWGPAGVDSVMLQTAQMDGKGMSQREEKEGGSSGKAVIAARVKLLVGYDYAGVAISGDKVTRAKPFRAQCEAGNVWLVRGAWNAAYLEELSTFPTGRHDDQCLVAGTMVLTARGEVPIERVTCEDWAWTRQGYKRVERAWQTADAARVWRMTLEDGRVLRGTGGHPVATEPLLFVRLQMLGPGRSVLTCASTAGEMDACHRGEVRSVWCEPVPQAVYNLTVEDVHEYVANGVVVKNCDASSCAFNAVLLEPSPITITGEGVMMPHVSAWTLGRGGGTNPALGTSFEE